MKRPCLPLPAVQAPTTKILPTKRLNIAEPQIFCPPKITRYTVSCNFVGYNLIKLHSLVEIPEIMDIIIICVTCCLYTPSGLSLGPSLIVKDCLYK